MSVSVWIYLIAMIVVGLLACVLPIARMARRPWGELIWAGAWALGLLLTFFIIMAAGWLGNAEEHEAVTCAGAGSISLGAWFADAERACGGSAAVFRYCERFRSPRLCQPLNTFSDLGFVAAGFWIMWLVQSGRLTHASSALPNPMSGRSAISWTYGAIVIFMGPGSMLLHASFHHAEGFLDAFSVVLWAGFGFAYTTWRLGYQAGLRPWGWQILLFWGPWALLTAGFIITELLASPTSRAVTIYEVIAGGLFMVMEILFLCVFWGRRNVRLTILSLMLISLAIVLWFPSGAIAHDFCSPDCADQGHALFHIMAAIATLTAFASFQSERE